jgi:hypothetical protein
MINTQNPLQNFIVVLTSVKSIITIDLELEEKNLHIDSINPDVMDITNIDEFGQKTNTIIMDLIKSHNSAIITINTVIPDIHNKLIHCINIPNTQIISILTDLDGCVIDLKTMKN